MAVERSRENQVVARVDFQSSQKGEADFDTAEIKTHDVARSGGVAEE
jgi:hypothetical protein